LAGGASASDGFVGVGGQGIGGDLGAESMGHLANLMKEGLARDPIPVPTALPAELAAALALAGRLAAGDEVGGGGGVKHTWIDRGHNQSGLCARSVNIEE
jgi:hypothetical protein